MMNIKPFESKQQFKTSEFQLSITCNGKPYAICDSAQYKVISSTIKENFISQMNSEGKSIEENEVDKAVAKEIDDAGFATLEMILSRMTPAEVAQWQVSYRFTPFTRRKL
jgi:hypothetical protein